MSMQPERKILSDSVIGVNLGETYSDDLMGRLQSSRSIYLTVARPSHANRLLRTLSRHRSVGIEGRDIGDDGMLVIDGEELTGQGVTYEDQKDILDKLDALEDDDPASKLIVVDLTSDRRQTQEELPDTGDRRKPYKGANDLLRHLSIYSNEPGRPMLLVISTDKRNVTEDYDTETIEEAIFDNELLDTLNFDEVNELGSNDEPATIKEFLSHIAVSAVVDPTGAKLQFLDESAMDEEQPKTHSSKPTTQESLALRAKIAQQLYERRYGISD